AVDRGICERDGDLFVLVRRPKVYAKTAEEKAAKRREWRKRWEAKNPKYNAEWCRRNRAKPLRVVKPKVEKAVPGVRDVSADVAAFLANGGKVERLPRFAVSHPFKHIGVAA